MRSFIPMVQGCVSRWGSGYVQGLHFFNLASALFMSFCGSWGYQTVTFSLKWRKLCQEVNIFHYLGLLVMWSEVAQSCPTLCDPVDCSPPGSSIHGILQGRILVGLPFSSVEEVKIVALCTPWGRTRTVPQGHAIASWLLLPCLCSPSFCCLETVWILRDGQGGWSVFLTNKKAGIQKGFCSHEPQCPAWFHRSQIRGQTRNLLFKKNLICIYISIQLIYNIILENLYFNKHLSWLWCQVSGIHTSWGDYFLWWISL